MGGRERFGADLLDTVRSAAEALAGGLRELPGYVLVPWIGGNFPVHAAEGVAGYGAAARR